MKNSFEKNVLKEKKWKIVSQRFIYEICFAFFDATRLCFWVYLEDTNTWLHYKLFSDYFKSWVPAFPLSFWGTC
jgi:hypothetical protein